MDKCVSIDVIFFLGLYLERIPPEFKDIFSGACLKRSLT